jgi:hypothetical protein
VHGRSEAWFVWQEWESGKQKTGRAGSWLGALRLGLHLSTVLAPAGTGSCMRQRKHPDIVISHGPGVSAAQQPGTTTTKRDLPELLIHHTSAHLIRQPPSTGIRGAANDTLVLTVNMADRFPSLEDFDSGGK